MQNGDVSKRFIISSTVDSLLQSERQERTIEALHIVESSQPKSLNEEEQYNLTQLECLAEIAAQLKNTLQDVQAQLASREKRQKSLDSQIQSLQKQLSEVAKASESLRCENRSLKREKASLLSQKQTLEQQRKKLASTNDLLNQSNQKLSNQVSELQAKIFEYSEKNTTLMEEVESLQKQNKKVILDKVDIQTKNNTLIAKNKLHMKSKQKLIEEKNQTVTNKIQAESERDAANKSNIKLSKENEKLKSQIKRLKKKISFVNTLYNWLSSCWNSCTALYPKQIKRSKTKGSYSGAKRKKPPSYKYGISALLVVAGASCVLTSLAIGCYLNGGVFPLIKNSYHYSYNMYRSIVSYTCNPLSFYSNIKTSAIEWCSSKISLMQSTLSSCSSYFIGKIYDAKCAIADFVIHSINIIIQKIRGFVEICYG